MPGRHSQPHTPNESARRVTLLAGAGVAGLVSVIAAVPLAGAGPVGAATNATQSTTAASTTSTTTTTTTTTATPATTTAPDTSEPVSSTTTVPETSEPASSTTTAPQTSEHASSTTTATAPEITPDYGARLLRIGVRKKDGSYVPPTSSTAGTHITLTQTIPDVANPFVTHCVTTAGSNVQGDAPSATFCDFSTASTSRRILAKRYPNAVREPINQVAPPQTQAYPVAPGATVVIEQDTAQPGYRIDPAGPVTVGPCLATPDPGTTDTGDDGSEERRAASANAEGGLRECTLDDQQVVFEDPGLPPVAGDDSARTAQGATVDISVAKNDTAKAPVTGVTIAGDPKHGTARLVSAADDPAPSTSAAAALRAPQGGRRLTAVTSYLARYTPAAGFVGVDTFRYTITTANGTATATVRVSVAGGSPDTSSTSSRGVDPESESRDPDSNDSDLAGTGARSGELVGWGVGLLVAGAGAFGVGTRRRRGRHAD